MTKYRFCYAKFGDAKYVSHLDLIRLFSRAFKRAGVPLSYSEGFNPHPKMAIALPLSVGVTSECECLDAELDCVLKKEDVERLNEKMPMGIRMNAVAEIRQGMSKPADIRWATYRITTRSFGLTREKIEAFMNRESVIVEKKTKRKEAETDILPDITDLSLVGETDEGSVLSMTLSAGSSASLKVDLVLAAMTRYIEDFRLESYDVHRVRILDQNGRDLLSV